MFSIQFDTADTNLSLSGPTSIVVAGLTDSGLSVTSRKTYNGLPRLGAPLWMPLLSKITNAHLVKKFIKGSESKGAFKFTFDILLKISFTGILILGFRWTVGQEAGGRRQEAGGRRQAKYISYLDSAKQTP